ncbi:MAG: hypothetical protein Q9M50_15165 [Methylococcales bacterium]|nr:hypothetical protein [Methylococcales bacterium]
MSAVKTETALPLMVFDTNRVKNELQLNQPFHDENSELQQRAQASVEQLLGIKPHNIKEKITVLPPLKPLELNSKKWLQGVRICLNNPFMSSQKQGMMAGLLRVH